MNDTAKFQAYPRYEKSSKKLIYYDTYNDIGFLKIFILKCIVYFCIYKSVYIIVIIIQNYSRNYYYQLYQQVKYFHFSIIIQFLVNDSYSSVIFRLLLLSLPPVTNAFLFANRVAEWSKRVPLILSVIILTQL